MAAVKMQDASERSPHPGVIKRGAKRLAGRVERAGAQGEAMSESPTHPPLRSSHTTGQAAGVTRAPAENLALRASVGRRFGNRRSL